MTTIKCSGQGCTAVFETSEPVSPKATYTCRLHTKPTGAKEHFQKVQFDKDMRRAAHPLGTTHIRNQGSELDNNEGTQDTMRNNAALIHGK